MIGRALIGGRSARCRFGAALPTCRHLLQWPGRGRRACRQPARRRCRCQARAPVPPPVPRCPATAPSLPVCPFIQRNRPGRGCGGRPRWRQRTGCGLRSARASARGGGGGVVDVTATPGPLRRGSPFPRGGRGRAWRVTPCVTSRVDPRPSPPWVRSPTPT